MELKEEENQQEKLAVVLTDKWPRCLSAEVSLKEHPVHG